MLDLRLIREQAEFVKAELGKLYAEPDPRELIDEIVRLDDDRRRVIAEVERLRAELNLGSRETGRKAAGPEREAHIAAMRLLGDRITVLDGELGVVNTRLDEVMLQVPNLPAADVPVGKDESENVITATWGEPRTFDFEPKAHWDLGPALGILDFERGVKVSGSRFYFLRGAGARLQRAVIAWMLDLHTTRHGYTEVLPPYLVLEKAMVGTGNLPKFAAGLFRDAEAGMWLIPTAEVPVTNMYREEILAGEQLPINHVAYSACFRNEQAAAGRDVRGIKRGFQFDKVEMVKFVTPETSDAEHEALVRAAEEVLRQLEIPYRRNMMCTGDLSFVAAKKIDLEAWAPGCGEWLEVSSCSNFHDFQARRAEIRYRPAPGERPRFVHTLNGSGLALPRTMIAIMENYQQADGSIEVPEVLQPYLRGMREIRAEV